MEQSLEVLWEGREEREFLRVTSTALKIIQNIQNEPSEEKYRRLRTTAAFCVKPGASQLLEALGFEQRGRYYVLDETFVSSLCSKTRDILAARKKTKSILGWDTPFSMIKFVTALGTCKYGEVFGGTMLDEEVAIKILKPDGGELARECFDRELGLLHKLDHVNLVQLQAVTLTYDPTCIILEFLPTSLLEVLNHSEMGDKETTSIALQIAGAMDYLHCSQGVVHCDLGARNVRLTDSRVVAKLCDFGLARSEGSTLSLDQVKMLPLRWTAPEVLQQQTVTRHSDLWSFGVFLYELVTSGSVPYASYSNEQVRSKVIEGYRLPQPQNCPDELYSLMLHCWLPQATERRSFGDLIRNQLDRIKVKVQEGRLTRQNSSISDDLGGDVKRNTLSGGGGGTHKLKVKEPSYPQVLAKGGGLLRVYTALISPFHHRVTIICGRKTTTSEVVQIALAKCGKHDLDHRAHSLALVNPHSLETPARYLGPDDRVLEAKTTPPSSPSSSSSAPAPPDLMFVLCVYSPGPAILEVVNSIKHNPAYGFAFDLCTRGYLVTMETGEGVGTGKRGRQQMTLGGHRRWCVLDGSSLLCYRDEEDEGVKQYESFVDVKNCSVSALSGKKSTAVRVGMADGGQFVFSASDRPDMLHWIEAISTAAHLEPSTMLLHYGDGVIVQTGYLDCQEFALESNSGVKSPPPLNRRLGTSADFSGTYSAVDYGRHWTVLKSSGLVQCLVRGRPETLFSLADATKVKVHNPRDMRKGGHYHISLYDEASRVVLQAECPSDHFDWTVAVERVLQDKGLQDRLCGDRGKQSGYVTLKRLMKMQEGGKLGDRGSAMQLYAMPRLLDTLDDVYEPSPVENAAPQPPVPPARSDGVYENSNPLSPLSPPAYVNFVPPPPLPPRTTLPPLFPKGTLGSGSLGAPEGLSSVPLEDNEMDDEYVLMNPQSLPATPSGPKHVLSPPRSVPTTPNDAHPPMRLPSQPISIPHRPPGKPAKLFLRSLSEASSPSSPSHAHRPSPSSSSTASLPRATPSSSSLTSSHSLHTRPAPPDPCPVPTRTQGRSSSSGYGSPLECPLQEKSRSNQFGKPVGTSDCAAPSDSEHPISQATSVSGPQRKGSDGYSSSPEEVVQPHSRPLPAGWRKGYCDSRVFFVNTETGTTTWNLDEVLAATATDKGSSQPGGKWQVVTLEDGQVYYYNDVTRETTWNVQDTFT